MRAIASVAYAKINLGLEILNKRQDGYHDINTVFARVRLHDSLLVSSDDQTSGEGNIKLVCTPSLDIPPQENLVYKAAECLRTFCGFAGGVGIVLRKSIPSGAGLGGGSSDAAACLRALRSLWRLDVNDHDLHKLALDLGSDVPFFLHDGAAVGRGRGELLSFFPLRLPFWTAVIVAPIHISTAWAYREIRMSKAKSASDFKAIVQRGLSEPQSMRRHLRNDFEEVVMHSYPQIAAIKHQLYDAGASFALMSGSGSAVFAFFATQTRAEAAAQGFDGPQTYVCPPDS